MYAPSPTLTYTSSPWRPFLHPGNFNTYVNRPTQNPCLTTDSLTSILLLSPMPMDKSWTLSLPETTHPNLVLQNPTPWPQFPFLPISWSFYYPTAALWPWSGHSSLEPSFFFLAYISPPFCPSRQESMIHHTLKSLAPVSFHCTVIPWDERDPP